MNYKLIASWLMNKSNIGHILGYGLLLIIIIYGLIWHFKNPKINTVYGPTPPVQEVIRWKIKTIQVPVETGKVSVLDKESLVKHVSGLPNSFVNDPAMQATSSGEIAPYEGKTNVFNFMNTKTGASEVYSQQQPLPFMAFQSKSGIGGRYGIADGKQEGDIYFQDNLVRVGTFQGFVYGEVSFRPSDSDRQVGYKAMVGVYHPF
jgi:hypothetical protein